MYSRFCSDILDLKKKDDRRPLIIFIEKWDEGVVELLKGSIK